MESASKPPHAQDRPFLSTSFRENKLRLNECHSPQGLRSQTPWFGPKARRAPCGQKNRSVWQSKRRWSTETSTYRTDPRAYPIRGPISTTNQVGRELFFDRGHSHQAGSDPNSCKAVQIAANSRAQTLAPRRTRSFNLLDSSNVTPLAKHTGNVVPRKGLRVRISCPPLL